MIGSAARLTAVPTHEGDRVTTLELFFDLAFVFAFTQLSRLMAEHHDLVGVVQAMTILALLWWAWNSYGWLANLAHADRGWVGAVMLAAMGSVVVVGVTAMHAYRALEEDLFAPFVFLGAYLAARIIHAVSFAAVSTPELRRQAFTTSALAIIPSGALLVVGAFLGGGWQVGLWVAAAAVEPVVTQRMSASADWRVGSTAHFTERHGLIVILAIGESIIAIGTGVASVPMSGGILAGIALALTIAAALWWAYFRQLAEEAEQALIARAAPERAHTARDGYTYLHLAIVASIVVTALGVEESLARIASHEPLGWLAASALAVGLAGYLGSTAWFSRMVASRARPFRAFLGAGVAATAPLLATLAAVPALGTAAGLLVAGLIAEALVGRRGARTRLTTSA